MLLEENLSKINLQAKKLTAPWHLFRKKSGGSYNTDWYKQRIPEASSVVIKLYLTVSLWL